MIQRLAITCALAGALVLTPGGMTPASACGHVAMFVESSYSSNEPGTVTIAIRRDANACGGPSSVDYTTVDDTAKAGSDYTATSGTVTFNNPEPPDAERTFTVPILDDGDEEGAESFKVMLKMSPVRSGAITSVGPPTTVTIAANDQAAPPQQPAPAPAPAAPTTAPTTAAPPPPTTAAPATPATAPVVTTTTAAEAEAASEDTAPGANAEPTAPATTAVDDDELVAASASADDSNSAAPALGVLALALAGAATVGYRLRRQGKARGV